MSACISIHCSIGLQALQKKYFTILGGCFCIPHPLGPVTAELSSSVSGLREHLFEKGQGTSSHVRCDMRETARSV